MAVEWIENGRQKGQKQQQQQREIMNVQCALPLGISFLFFFI